jgi:hypothetical protein
MLTAMVPKAVFSVQDGAEINFLVKRNSEVSCCSAKQNVPPTGKFPSESI